MSASLTTPRMLILDTCDFLCYFQRTGTRSTPELDMKPSSNRRVRVLSFSWPSVITCARARTALTLCSGSEGSLSTTKSTLMGPKCVVVPHSAWLTRLQCTAGPDRSRIRCLHWLNVLVEITNISETVRRASLARSSKRTGTFKKKKKKNHCLARLALVYNHVGHASHVCTGSADLSENSRHLAHTSYLDVTTRLVEVRLGPSLACVAIRAACSRTVTRDGHSDRGKPYSSSVYFSERSYKGGLHRCGVPRSVNLFAATCGKH